MMMYIVIVLGKEVLFWLNQENKLLVKTVSNPI